MGRLILNADDFGLTAGVNRAIIELHRAGVLTSATLMASARPPKRPSRLPAPRPRSAWAATWFWWMASRCFRAQEIPTLVDPRTGRFHLTLGAFLDAALHGPHPRR